MSGNSISNINIEKFFSNEENDDLKNHSTKKKLFLFDSLGFTGFK